MGSEKGLKGCHPRVMHMKVSWGSLGESIIGDYLRPGTCLPEYANGIGVRPRTQTKITSHTV